MLLMFQTAQIQPYVLKLKNIIVDHMSIANENKSDFIVVQVLQGV